MKGKVLLLFCIGFAVEHGVQSLAFQPSVRYRYLGCYWDNMTRILDQNVFVNDNMTTEMCFEYCNSNGMRFFLTETLKYCFCGNVLKFLVRRPETECNMLCGGDSSEKCGSVSRGSVYDTMTEETGYCRSFPCKNAGSCISYDDHFECICPRGWTGPDCSIAFQPSVRYLGCYYDSVPRMLDKTELVSDNMTTAMCFDYCHIFGTRYFLTEYAGQCFCGNAPKFQILWPDTDCNMLCGGDSSEKCGGFNRASVYDTMPQATDYCSSSPCKKADLCVSYSQHYKCSCLQGWTGVDCSKDVDECSSSNPCNNGGTCVNTPGHYMCHCKSGWSGDNCQTDADECSPSDPCNNGGTCVNTPGHYMCHCKRGWSGDNCQTDVDECSPSNPCNNGGTCVNTIGHYMCHCKSGWSGDNCQTDVDECFPSNPCNNGGTCVNTPGHYMCHCKSGWSGDVCQTDVDECSPSNPCKNGGTCVNTLGHYRCHCKSGWSGDNCQTDINECLLNNPCNNGGTCLNNAGSYTCNCAHGSTGRHCETLNDPCLLFKPCQHGGTCSFTQGYISWHCMSGWTDGQCQSDIDECRNANQCQNGGTCINTAGNYQCNCPSGWTGEHCQTDINECMSVAIPCRNGGTCVNTAGSYNCHCPSGLTGQHCQTETFPMCNHTCFLNAVLLATAVKMTNYTCINPALGANAVFPSICCDIPYSDKWIIGAKIESSGACIVGEIPSYTPVSAFNSGSPIAEKAGIFARCIKTGTPGFMMFRQSCNELPTLVNITGTEAQNYYVINV